MYWWGAGAAVDPEPPGAPSLCHFHHTAAQEHGALASRSASMYDAFACAHPCCDATNAAAAVITPSCSMTTGHDRWQRLVDAPRLQQLVQLLHRLPQHKWVLALCERSFLAASAGCGARASPRGADRPKARATRSLHHFGARASRAWESRRSDGCAGAHDIQDGETCLRRDAQKASRAW